MTVASRLGRYRIVRRLGRGGLAEVFLVEAQGAEGFSKKLVVKRLRAAVAQHPEVVDMIAAEAKLVTRLSHGNIVQVFDFAREGDEPYLVMEYVDGASLHELMVDMARRGEALAPGEVAFVIEAVAAALQYAHDALHDDGRPLGIVHCDVTPANVLVSREGVVKLADFGIARVSLTQTASAEAGRGTPGYLAPEQEAGGELDRRTDVFALGTVLRDLLEALPDPPAPLRAVADRARANDPGDRYPTAADLAAEVDTWRASASVRRGPGGLAERVTRLRRGRAAATLALPDDHDDGPVTRAALDSEQPGVPTAPPRRAWWIAAVVLVGVAVAAVWAWPGAVVDPQATTPSGRIDSDPPPPTVPTKDPPLPAPLATSTGAGAGSTGHSTPVSEATSTGGPTTTGIEPPPPKPARKGRLRLNLVPYAMVRLDGRARGKTPLNIAVRAGQHRLELHNPQTGQRVSRRITVEPGRELMITSW